ncbi:MAG: hypothetical protein ACLQPH_22130 [Acidimicrobiales bacterium]
MSRRKDAKALARWREEARKWGTAAGRDLALNLYYNQESIFRAYEVGVVLDPGERVWAEVPVQFNLDWTLPGKAGQAIEPAVRPWLVTSDRVVGRLADEQLYGYRWERSVGARVDLTPGFEFVRLDIEGEPTLVWSGPAVAPLAVAAVFQLYGPIGVLEHPGLVTVRVGPEDLH